MLVAAELDMLGTVSSAQVKILERAKCPIYYDERLNIIVDK